MWETCTQIASLNSPQWSILSCCAVCIEQLSNHIQFTVIYEQKLSKLPTCWSLWWELRVSANTIYLLFQSIIRSDNSVIRSDSSATSHSTNHLIADMMLARRWGNNCDNRRSVNIHYHCDNPLHCSVNIHYLSSPSKGDAACWLLSAVQFQVKGHRRSWTALLGPNTVVVMILGTQWHCACCVKGPSNIVVSVSWDPIM